MITAKNINRYPVPQTASSAVVSSNVVSLGKKIYCKAKVLSEEEFIEFYDRNSLQNKI